MGLVDCPHVEPYKRVGVPDCIGLLVSVLLSTSIERVVVSRMRDLKKIITGPENTYVWGD